MTLKGRARARGINDALTADFVVVARVLVTRKTPANRGGKRTHPRREKVRDETYIVCDVRH